MTRGKIVLIPFPFDNLSSTKVRLALCLTEPVGKYRHIVVAFITSRIPDEILDSDLGLDTHSIGFHETGLRVSSTVRLHRLMTITTSIIRRELGKLPSQFQDEIDKKLKEMFNLEE